MPTTTSWCACSSMCGTARMTARPTSSAFAVAAVDSPGQRLYASIRAVAEPRPEGLSGGRGVLRLRDVAARDREEDDEPQDAGEEDVARARGAKPEAAVLLAVLRHEVADRGAQRARQDVREPERENRVELEREMRDRDGGDEAAEDRDRDA